MTGRIFSFEMYGLTIDEILNYKNIAYFQSKNTSRQKLDILNSSILDSMLPLLKDTPFVAQIRELVDEYMVWG